MTSRAYPLPTNERERLAALHDLDIIGSGREPEFDAVVQLACDAFKVPIAWVSLLDEHEQWFKASEGVNVCSTDREIAFCNFTVASGEMLIVNDALQDVRFRQNPLVIGGPQVRFYAGVPICLELGLHLGTFCIADVTPRDFTADEASQISRFANIVTALIRQYRAGRRIARSVADLNDQTEIIRCQTDALTRINRLFDRASVLTKMGAWEWTVATNAVALTDGVYDIHELQSGSITTREQFAAYYSEESRRELQKLIMQAQLDRAGFIFEGRMTTALGNKRWVRLTVNVECENGEVTRFYGMTQDITESKGLWDHMKFLAEFDVLTELPNRSVFQTRLLEVINRAGVKQGSVTLLLVDLDGFKHINDTFGHSAGDECLKRIARRLASAFEEAELVARLGGDEFAIVFTDPDLGPTEERARRLLTTLRRPVRWEGQSFQLNGSVGVAIAHLGEVPASGLFAEADLALYAAKAAGRNTFRTFAPEMQRNADRRFAIVRDIAAALRDNQIELFYQPKINMSSASLSGFEALLRWRHPDGRIIAAGAFAAALEDPELSGRIGEWVIEKALSQAQEWNAAGLALEHIAINLSSSQFYTPNFAQILINQVAARGLLPEMIEVEVTEGVFLNQEANVIKEALETLRRARIRIALDDFGTGYASLVHLRNYPVDILKIDKSFVQNCLCSPSDNAIVQSTLFLAKQLGLDVVAEGIETTEQFAFLKALGCRFGQGYLFSKAISASEAVKWCSDATVALVGVA